MKLLDGTNYEVEGISCFPRPVIVFNIIVMEYSLLSQSQTRKEGISKYPKQNMSLQLKLD